MTEEECRNMLQRLRASAPITKYDGLKAAAEIERLIKENKELQDASAGPIGPPPNQGSGGKRPALEVKITNVDASAEPRVTLDEIEAAMDRVLERRGLTVQINNLERRSAW